MQQHRRLRHAESLPDARSAASLVLEIGRKAARNLALRMSIDAFLLGTGSALVGLANSTADDATHIKQGPFP
jgi:hypothetical protein